MAAPRKPKNPPSSEVPGAKKSPSNPPGMAQPRATRSRTRAQSVDAEQPAEQRTIAPAEAPSRTAPTPIDGERNRSFVSETGAAGVSVEEAIRRRAYELYEQRGRQDGRAVEDWLRAESELGSRGQRSVA